MISKALKEVLANKEFSDHVEFSTGEKAKQKVYGVLEANYHDRKAVKNSSVKTVEYTFYVNTDDVETVRIRDKASFQGKNLEISSIVNDTVGVTIIEFTEEFSVRGEPEFRART